MFLINNPKKTWLLIEKYKNSKRELNGMNWFEQLEAETEVEKPQSVKDAEAIAEWWYSLGVERPKKIEKKSKDGPLELRRRRIM
jgi:hypothetical protein